MRRLISSLLLLLGLGLAGGVSATTCSISPDSSTIAFPDVPVGSSPASTEMTISVTVTCDAGVNWRLYPFSTSTNSAVQLALTNGGSANGSAYLFLRRQDGTLMVNSNTATHVTGTGTGSAQSVQLTVFLADTTAGTTAVSRLGTFSRAWTMLTLKKLDNNATYNTSSQSISGAMVGSCTLAAPSTMDFGTNESSANQLILTKTSSLTVLCATGVAYKIYADSPTAPGGTWIGSSLRPVVGQTTNFVMTFQARPSGGTYQTVNNLNYLSATGTGITQLFDFEAQLSVAPKAVGSWSFTLRPTIVF